MAGLWQKGQSGNAAGRPLGVANKRSQEAMELMKDLKYDPIERQVRLAMKIEKRLAHNHFKDVNEKLRLIEILVGVYKATTPYAYPMLKSVEHSGIPAQAATTPEDRKQRILTLLSQVEGMAGDAGIALHRPSSEAVA